ncbi:MAG TPA: DUF3592 domain-containing protein [Candidatus Angelobacter sp.]
MFCAFTIAGAVGAIINWRRRVAARNWPIVAGTVEQTSAKYFNECYFAEIFYSYEVNSEFYSGQYTFPESRSSSDGALKLAAPWRKRKIFVRYNPADPQKSVLIPSDTMPPPD